MSVSTAGKLSVEGVRELVGGAGGCGGGVIRGSAPGRNCSMMRTRLEWHDARGMMRK